MTNKFRDALEEERLNRNNLIAMQSGFDGSDDLNRLIKRAQVRIEALTIAAALQEEAETIKALDAICDRYYADEVIGAEVMIAAMDASPVIKKLAKLVKEGE